MPPRFARRITATSDKNFGMFAKAVALPGDLIHLELGMPAQDTPPHIKEATIAALQAGDVHYSDLQGMPALRAALAAKMRADGVRCYRGRGDHHQRADPGVVCGVHGDAG